MSIEQVVYSELECQMKEIEQHLDSSFDKINNLIDQLFTLDNPIKKINNFESDLQLPKINEFHLIYQSNFQLNIFEELKPLINQKITHLSQIKQQEQSKDKDNNMKNSNQIKMKKAVLLTGQIGTGRTTLFNKITNSQQKSKNGGDGVTRDTYVKNSQYGEGFTLIDTLGFGDSNNINTISGHLKIFENIEISRIMIVARYARNNCIVESCKGIIEMFQRYKDKITIVITSFDLCDKEYEPNFKNDIAKYFEEFQIKSFIITSKQDTGETLCKLFDSEIKQSQASKIELTEIEILSILQCVGSEIEAFEYMQIQRNLQSYFHTLLIKLKQMNRVDLQENYVNILRKAISLGFTQFNNFFVNYLDEQQQYVMFITFMRFLIEQTLKFLVLGEQKKILVAQKEIDEFKNLIRNEMKNYKELQQYSQQCLQNINENVKNQKINYL